MIILIALILACGTLAHADYIKSWYICGPFAGDTLETPSFENEGKIIPKEGKVSGGKKWKEYDGMGNVLDFESPGALGTSDLCNGFAYVEIESKESRTALLLLGSDDGARVWLNGETLLNNEAPRGLSMDQDRININLKKGRNRLLIKVNDAAGGWSLAARVVDHNGSDIPGLKYYPGATIKLAPVKEATASSVESGDYAASKAFDGDAATRWSSKHQDPQWITANLGEMIPVSGVTIKWETAAAKSYSIDLSPDNKNWKTVYSTDDGQGGDEKIEFKPVKARYVRMSGTSRATPYGYSIFEFNIISKITK